MLSEFEEYMWKNYEKMNSLSTKFNTCYIKQDGTITYIFNIQENKIYGNMRYFLEDELTFLSDADINEFKSFIDIQWKKFNLEKDKIQQLYDVSMLEKQTNKFQKFMENIRVGANPT